MSEDKFITRREFVTIMVGIGGSVAVATALSDLTVLQDLIDEELALEFPDAKREVSHHADGSFRWGMVINLQTCIGCDYCVYACQAINDVPDDMRWNVHLVDETETGDPFHITRPCLHCNDAPCTSVCPVAATFSREDGLVIMDYDRCIGCRYCQVACPYGARSFNWRERVGASGYQDSWGAAEIERRPRGVVEKCTFCVHRIDAGLKRGLLPGVDRAATPACVNVCPVEARVFGNLNDPESKVSRLIRENPTFRLREDLGTEPNVYYIPPKGMAL